MDMADITGGSPAPEMCEDGGKACGVCRTPGDLDAVELAWLIGVKPQCQHAYLDTKGAKGTRQQVGLLLFASSNRRWIGRIEHHDAGFTVLL